MTGEQPGVGKRKRGKGPHGKRELAKKRAAIEAALQRVKVRKRLGIPKGF